MLVTAHNEASATFDNRRRKKRQAFSGRISLSRPWRDRIAPVSGREAVQRSLVEVARWTRVHPLVDLRRECEHRAAVTRAGTTDRQASATFPSLCGANAT